MAELSARGFFASSPVFEGGVHVAVGLGDRDRTDLQQAHQIGAGPSRLGRVLKRLKFGLLLLQLAGVVSDLRLKVGDEARMNARGALGLVEVGLKTATHVLRELNLPF